jgi:transposase
MGYVEMEILSSCLCLPENIVIASVAPTTTSLVMHIACQDTTAACPLCQQCSERIHGSYVRTVADVPCGGRRVLLSLTVRKFVCGTPTCLRTIFTERLPDFVQSYARMTNRLKSALQAIGLAAGGETGTRLAAKVGILTKASTLLYHVLSLPDDLALKVRILGVDDWSWKKGRRDGTILVDLEKRKIIDLLPDRSSATFAQWLRAHPEVEIISRNRGADFAAGAREGAPQARQIADRFHLVRNLSEVLQPLLARCRTEIRRAKQEESSEGVQDALPSEQVPPEPTRMLPHPDTWKQQPPQQMLRAYQARQREREDLFCHMTELRAQRMKLADIAKHVGKSERCVRAWLKHGGAPEHKRPGRRSVFDPYARYVLERWQAGVYDGRQLYEEIRAQGFTGTIRIVQRFLQTLREERRPLIDLAPSSPEEQFSSHNAVWLFIRDLADLTTEEQGMLTTIRHASVTADAAYGFVQEFLTMVRKRQGERLDAWLAAIQESQIPELQRFALGILRDKDAVMAGLTEIYSNGPVEAQVHKLKFIKRSMFGRAKLPLLRQRLLHAI